MMVPRRRLIAAVCAMSTLTSTTTTAFTPHLPSVSVFSAMSKSSTRHNVLPPDQILDYSDLLNHVAHTSTLMADAAAAAASQQPTGWWGSYISIFKGTLEGVHSVIDQPLRSVGIDQTWGISIGLFTIMCRSLLLPLSIQQSKSAEYMKALKPYVSEIKAKFKNNQDAQNRLVGKLYEDAKQNPLSGCLVSLAQIPIFLGLYRGVRLLALDGKLEQPFLFIPSLEGPVSPPDYRGMDWLLSGWTTIDGTPTPPLGWETTLAFLAMPVILVMLQSLTMSVLQPPIDDNASEEERKQLESTQGILKFLPLLIGFFSLQVPAGLTIYWFSSNIFTLTQSLSVRAYFAANPPKIELPEYWEQINQKKDFKDMTPEERRKATEAGFSVGPSFDDLVMESKFHVLVERQPFRVTTEAWKRVESSSNNNQIPAVMQEWAMSGSSRVGSSTNGAHAEKILNDVGKMEETLFKMAASAEKELQSSKAQHAEKVEEIHVQQVASIEKGEAETTVKTPVVKA